MEPLARTASPHENEARYKINVFAMPSLTTILVIILTCVVFGTLLAVGINAQRAIFVPLLLGMVALSLRGLLAWPEREYAMSRLRPAGPEFKAIQECIARLAGQIDLKRVPVLMIGTEEVDLSVFGSWRR